MVTATEERIAYRYTQADLHDIRRTAERWWALLNGSSIAGLSEPERALMNACSTIMSRVRPDGLDVYHLVDPQLRLWGEDAA